ncbi:hypothetical protein J6590_018776 [Homalodisca vitripennis]|nr:hypothetical protein J6590_018776 [Homalodisca vitripennis]
MTCGASIKTDANMTRVTVCNTKHSGLHPVTMRSLLSPQTKPSTTTTDAALPSHVPVASPTLAPPPACSTPAPATPSGPAVTPSSTLEDPEEIHTLRKKLERLEEEYQKLLNHTIESDTRLLQFTDQIFPVNTSPRVDLTDRASAAVDCGVQCEAPPLAFADSGVQCDLLGHTTCVVSQCAENTELIKKLKTTLEVLEAENQCLRLQIEKRDCSEPWTEVKSRKTSKVAVRKTSRDQLREEKISIDSKQKQHNKRKNSNRSKGKTHQKTKGQKLKPNQQPNDRSFQTSILRLKSITIRGDSHTRHVAGMVMKLIGPGTSVSGMCKPGAKLLDIIQPDQTSTGPGPRCEVLIAGTNDLAVGEQCNIYRYLEDYIDCICYNPAQDALVNFGGHHFGAIVPSCRGSSTI